ncbi:MAG: hypothetical protein IJW86_05235 [Clostridia bacterium]|nr:hypothetical protein [Clostridia bacterium]
MINRFVAFDIEMPSQHKPRISAIGITAVENGVITEKAYYLVNPEVKFDPYVIELIGITPEMVANEPTFPEIWEKIKDVMSSGVLVAHGAPGDMKALCGCLKSYGIEWKEKAQYICTCRVGLEKYPEYEHHSLDYMCQKIGFPLMHHYALSDSEGCARLMLDYIDKEVDIDSYIQEFDVIRCCNANKKRKPQKKRTYREKVTGHLFRMQNKKLREVFVGAHPHLEPDRVIGVKEGALRQYAEKLLETNRASDYIKLLPHYYYEENNLHAILVSKTKKLGTAFERIDEFLPYVTDTATCRLLVPYAFKKRQKELLPKINLWLSSSEPYTKFFALEIIERFFVSEEYIKHWKQALCEESEETYLSRKKASVLSRALISCPERIADIFKENRLNAETHNKAIELALRNESLSQEKRELLSSMTR